MCFCTLDYLSRRGKPLGPVSAVRMAECAKNYRKPRVAMSPNDANPGILSPVRHFAERRQVGTMPE
jgi:hypothetical protein